MQDPNLHGKRDSRYFQNHAWGWVRTKRSAFGQCWRTITTTVGLDAAACDCSQGTCPRYSGRACGQLCPVSREINIHDFCLWEKGDDKEFLFAKKYAHKKIENLNDARRKSLERIWMMQEGSLLEIVPKRRNWLVVPKLWLVVPKLTPQLLEPMEEEPGEDVHVKAGLVLSAWWRPYTAFLTLMTQSQIQTYKRFKRFIRTEIRNLQIFCVIPFVKLQNDT